MIFSLRLPDELVARLDAVRAANAGKVGASAPSRNSVLIMAVNRYVVSAERDLHLDAQTSSLNSGLDRLGAPVSK